MKSHLRFLGGAVMALILAALLITLIPTPDVAAFSHTWVNYRHLHVGAGQFGLWDDISAGSGAGEAGLLWFVNDGNDNENAGYRSSFAGLDTDTFSALTARAALNDGAEFWVGYRLQGDRGVCRWPDELKWLTAQADGAYRSKWFTLPANSTVDQVCIFLSDEPDATHSGRSSVLIDYVVILGDRGVTGWGEPFNGGNP